MVSPELQSDAKIRPLTNTVAVAARQFGLISRDQARTCGMSDGAIHYQLKHGWIRLHRSVYLLPGFETCWPQRVLALCMRGGRGTVASHLTAARLLHLEGCTVGDEIHLYARSNWSAEGVVIHRTSELPACDVTHAGPIPVTAISRTLLDLGSVTDEEQVEIALEFALRNKLTSVPRLRWRLDQVGGRGHPGSAVLRRLLDLRDPATKPAQSVLEVKFIRRLRARALPQPVRQYEVRIERRHRFIDFAFPHALLGIEVGGRQFHTGPAAEQRDSMRHNELTRLGWRILYFSWDDIEHRVDYVVDCIEQELRRSLF